MLAPSLVVTRAARIFGQHIRDVNHRHAVFVPSLSISTSTPNNHPPVPTTSTLTPKTCMQRQIQARTNQLQNQLKRSYHNMSNNADLQLGEVFNVKDKVALVTGGGSGIGLMITQTLAVNGAKVYIVGRTEEKLERVVEAHGKDIAGQIIPIQGDVASKEGVQCVFAS
jgi:FlaA1/EpsC-like NDP-sugar epimerase